MILEMPLGFLGNRSPSSSGRFFVPVRRVSTFESRKRTSSRYRTGTANSKPAKMSVLPSVLTLALGIGANQERKAEPAAGPANVKDAHPWASEGFGLCGQPRCETTRQRQ
jgi:hypothetical protein